MKDIIQQSHSYPTKRSESSNGNGELLNAYLTQIQIALNQEMDEPRMALYLKGLSDLTPQELTDAFEAALKCSKWLPTIPELRQWALDGAELRHRQIAEQERLALKNRPDKPEDGVFSFKLEEAWEMLEMRAELQEQEDLRMPEIPWDEAKRQGVRFVDWDRWREAHERRRTGEKRPTMYERYRNQAARLGVGK